MLESENKMLQYGFVLLRKEDWKLNKYRTSVFINDFEVRMRHKLYMYQYLTLLYKAKVLSWVDTSLIINVGTPGVGVVGG